MTDRMDPKAKADWVAALRSGGYVQGHGGLKRDDKFCCLGVLCDRSRGVTWEQQDDNQFATANYRYLLKTDANYRTCIPGALQNRLSIAWGQQLHLVTMNDVQRCSFNEIADWIEANM